LVFAYIIHGKDLLPDLRIGFAAFHGLKQLRRHIIAGKRIAGSGVKDEPVFAGGNVTLEFHFVIAGLFY
jgi:hypothetical protein